MPNVHDTAVHPGEVLLEVYIKPSIPQLTVSALASTIGVSEQHITEFIEGKRPISRALAEQLGVVCRTTTEYWLSLQRTYDRESKVNARRSVNKHPSRKAAA